MMWLVKLLEWMNITLLTIFGISVILRIYLGDFSKNPHVNRILSGIADRITTSDRGALRSHAMHERLRKMLRDLAAPIFIGTILGIVQWSQKFPFIAAHNPNFPDGTYAVMCGLMLCMCLLELFRWAQEGSTGYFYEPTSWALVFCVSIMPWLPSAYAWGLIVVASTFTVVVILCTLLNRNYWRIAEDNSE